MNVLFHCFATALVVIVARRLLPRRCASVGASVAGVTFAVHPVHTEAVAGIVGRADLAACNLFLLSFLVYLEHLKLRDGPKRSHTSKCKQITEGYMRRQRMVCSEQTFRLSCHGLVQQIVSNFRRLLKAGKIGPLRVLKGSRLVGFEPRESVRARRECECCVREIGEESEVLQWATLAGTLVLATAATLCKEPAITVLPLCIFYDFLRSARDESRMSKVMFRKPLCMFDVVRYIFRTSLGTLVFNNELLKAN